MLQVQVPLFMLLAVIAILYPQGAQVVGFVWCCVILRRML